MTMIRKLAAVALAMLSLSAAHAGAISNGTWTADSCGADPGGPPEISSKNANTYNKSMKSVQTWQDSVKNYTNCVVAEGKADQAAIVDSINKKMAAINDSNQAISTQSTAAVEKLNGGKARRSLGATSPHDQSTL